MLGLQKLSARSSHVLTCSLVVAFFAVTQLVGLNSWAVARTQRFLHPLTEFHMVATRSFVEIPFAFRQRSKTARRIQDLEFRLSESYAQLSELATLQHENEQLRQLLGEKNTPIARIITAPIVSFAQPAIAAGSGEGVVPGQIVLVASTLVGRVSVVKQQQSTITLLSQTDSQPLLAQTESGVQGLVVGDGRRIIVTEVPLDSKLENGERLTTVGQPGVPGGIFIGRVEAVESSPASATKTIVVEQLVSIYDAVVVEVR